MNNDYQLYINKIVKSLKEGSASVFVGAGFSLNGKPANETITESMPLWGDLLDYFCELLGMKDSKKDGQDNKKCLKYLNALSIAQDVADTYGRSELDSIIQEKMKDESFEPSDVHKLLLELPWNDIFTTNYDTLLERASKLVVNRRYNVIYNEQDLIVRSKSFMPRIIKLHGSFPSYRPFIITQEDYRTYPQKHAPFVNTVQQSLLENTFCLIGFSGDDPNFQKWIGWIHDNLGLENSPRIYLIVHERPDDILYKRLNSRKIDVVDLSSVYKTDGLHVVDYYKNFLEDLNKRVYREVSKKVENAKLWLEENFCFDAKSSDEIGEVLTRIHKEYPGWICAPEKYKKTISDILTETNVFYFNNEYDNLNLAYEYCWLSNIGNQIIDKLYLSKLEKTLKINKQTSEKDKYVYISCILLRSYRLLGMNNEWKNRFQDIKDNIKKDELDKNIQNMIIYEKIMNDLYQFKYNDLLKDIHNISLDDSKMIWSLRKASLLLIVQENEEAMNIISDNLFASRKILNNDFNENYYYQSLENCLSVLGEMIPGLEVKTENNYPVDNNNKYYYIDNDRMFIWDRENNKYVSNLNQKYDESSFVYTEMDFDLLSRTTYYNGNIFNYIRDTFSFLIFRENTGIPFRIGYIKKYDGIDNVVLSLTKKNKMIPAIMASFTGKKDLNYNRTVIAFSNEEEVNSIFNQVFNAYDLLNKNSMSKIMLTKFCYSTFPNIIGRLSVKISAENLSKLIKLLKILYNNKETKNFEESVSLIIYTMPTKYLVEKFNEILRILFEGDIDQEGAIIILKAIQKRLSLLDLKYENFRDKIAINGDLFNRLVKLAKREKEPGVATYWIAFLAMISKINEDQKKTLWDILALSKNKNFKSDLYKAISLVYPAQLPEGYYEDYTKWIREKIQNVFKDFKEYVNSKKFYIMSFSVDEMLFLIDKMDNQLLQEIKKYTCKHIENLNNELKKKNSSYYRGILEEQFKYLYVLLVRILVKENLLFIKDKDEKIEKVSEIFRENGIFAPALKIYGQNKRKAIQILIDDLLSGNETFQEESAYLFNYLIDDGLNVKYKEINLLIEGTKYHVQGYKWILYVLMHLCKKGFIKHENAKKLATYLNDIYERTKYNDNDSEPVIINKIITRQYASALAFELNNSMHKENKKNTNSVECWKENSKNKDEFVEVRNAWLDRKYIKERDQ